MKIYDVTEETTRRNFLIAANTEKEAFEKLNSWFTDDVIKEEMDRCNQSILEDIKGISRIMEWRKAWNEKYPENSFDIPEYPFHHIPEYPSFHPYSLREFKESMKYTTNNVLDFSAESVIEVGEIEYAQIGGNL